MSFNRNCSLAFFARPRTMIFLLFLFGSGFTARSQSVLGSIQGTVHDSSGAVISNATIHLHRTETNTDRDIRTDAAGNYTVLNVDAGRYNITAGATGFASNASTGISLLARQQLRFDIVLNVSSGNETVTVNASDAGTINTESSQISAALSPRDVLALPANYRGAGSTSPLNVIQTLPGVQPDSGTYPPQPSASPNPSIKFSLQGGLPSQSETTIDGISAQDVTANNILGDAFPSAESIAEIRVDAVGNNAQYGQPGEITTVTKAGTNTPHGSVFWYFQNSGFDAIPFGYDKTTKPKKVANDFGGSFGGPVVLPHLYNGHDRTFFFATYEGLRYPQSRGVQYLVPTTRMKAGDFSQETATLTNPFTGGIYPGAKLSAVNAASAPFLVLFPDPNVAPNESVAAARASRGYNYVGTRRNDINSNQYDLRGDQTFGQRASAFARYTHKSIDQTLPNQLAIPDGTAFARYNIFATSVNTTLTPNLANEFRFGFTLEENGNSNPLNGTALTNQANFNGVARTFPFNGVPYFGFDYLTAVGSRLNSTQRSRIFQYVDNVTWQRGRHTVVLGADLRHIVAITPLSFAPSDNYGNFAFHQSSSFTGQEFADFLIGTPELSQTDNITHDNNGSANAYAVYGQDTWKATPNLNLTFGLRYELHPAFTTNNGVLGNFDPSVPKSGRIVYNAGQAANLSVQELANVNACSTPGIANPYANNAMQNGAPCTPVVTNTQAGLPAGLRQTNKLRFEPRFGFAYRPFGNDRTALRGGVGYYNITTTGALFYALTGTVGANLQSFYNSQTATGPAFSFPNVSPAGNTFTPAFGSVVFYSAVDIPWHDPYSLQTNLSVDHDFGHGFALRASYIGLKTWHLVWQTENNVLPYSTTTPATSQPRTAFPFPNFASIPNRSTSAQAIYHAGQVELSHRFGNGFSLNSAYTFAKNLADNQGTYGTATGIQSFVDEQGGYNGTYTYDRHLDYGNVTGTRRHRSITSGVFELPVGRGKHYGSGMNRISDAAIGGWQISTILLLQSGPFLTAYIPSGTADPSGTGSGTLYFAQQRPDRVANGNSTHRTRANWFNNNAFACPGSTGFASLQNGQCTVGGINASGAPVSAPIGRFGTEAVGDLTGPGTVSLSAGLSKSFLIVEGVRLRTEGTFTNILNHTNLADPNLDTTSTSFGVITQARGSDFGGNRTGQVSMKLEF